MTKQNLTLVIGNRNYSSWSLRAWLFMRASGLEFKEIRIPMFEGDWKERITSYSAAGRVPVLLHGDVTIWDSTAIMAHLHECFEDTLGWPRDPVARGQARSIAAEMHSGFIAVRDELPQNLRAGTRLEMPSLSQTCRLQIDRIQSLWGELRKRPASDGQFLFGQPCIADVMYAPVALRFDSYSIPLDNWARDYVDTVLRWEPVQEWVDAAHKETERLDFIDNLIPQSDSPLTLG